MTENLDVEPGAIDWENGKEALAAIAQSIDDDDENPVYASFVSATASSTHSRRYDATWIENTKA